MLITQSKLQSLFIYDKDTGIFTWKHSGIKAGNTDKVTGYHKIGIDNKQYKAHRLAWIYMYDAVPNNIDHINHIKIDNRICNLRDVTHTQNNRNLIISKVNTSGVIGVKKRGTSFIAEIQVDNKKIYLGSFKNIEDAKEARCGAEVKYGFITPNTSNQTHRS